MGNGSGGTKGMFDILLSVIQVLLLPALGIIFYMVDQNASTLRKVEMNQVRVMTNLVTLEGELKEHEIRSLADVETRSRYHHQEIRSCLSCKERSGSTGKPYP